MPETENPAGQTTMTELVAGIVNDAQTLIKQQFAMLKAEIKDDIQQTAEASRFLGFGASLLGVGAIFLMAAAAPFFGGAGNIIGLLIIGFGLWEAWKTNRRVDLVINGPYSVAPAASV